MENGGSNDILLLVDRGKGIELLTTYYAIIENGKLIIEVLPPF